MQFHGPIEVFPPCFVRQGEVPKEFEATFPDRRNIIIQPSHGRIVQLEGGLDLVRWVVTTPNRIGESKVTAGSQ
jgi:hypothetical protein